MREYGGYIELESFHVTMFHKRAIALNCGRSALTYLCEAKHIKKLYIPYFLCSSVMNLCEIIGIKYEYYHITDRVMPILSKSLLKMNTSIS